MIKLFDKNITFKFPSMVLLVIMEAAAGGRERCSRCTHGQTFQTGLCIHAALGRECFYLKQRY